MFEYLVVIIALAVAALVYHSLIDGDDPSGCVFFLIVTFGVAWLLTKYPFLVPIIIVLPILGFVIKYKRQKKDEELWKSNQLNRDAELKAANEQREARELERQKLRDADQQETPYIYQIGRHGNESLAIRYGIANQEKKTKEYWYFGKGGEKRRNPDRDTIHYEPAKTIKLRKIGKIGKDTYEVLLTDFRGRRAKAVIEAGTEYVKTFYPLDDNWFKKHAELEETLKGNGSFTLKELATFHVQKAVGT